MKVTHNTNGFSLVELSIVLVILGLLVGGILSGKSLIRAAELRNIASERSKYLTATQSFRDKYFALPGDMTNASQFWGLAGAVNCNITQTISLTCNGDGNGKVEFSTPPDSYEMFRFWQHLSNAKLIEGQYCGVWGCTLPSVAGANPLPKSKIATAVWVAIYTDDITGTVAAASAVKFNGTYGNTLALALSAFGSGSVLTNEELWNLDSKIDDGKPGSGKMRVQSGTLSACTDAVDSTNGATANYKLSAAGNNCMPIFTNEF